MLRVERQWGGRMEARAMLQERPRTQATRASVSADVFRACVDRELSARGLNAYGDPGGTTYPGGPPAPEGGRVLYVAGRIEEIRLACSLLGY